MTASLRGALALLAAIGLGCAAENASAPAHTPEPERGWRAVSDSGRLVARIFPESGGGTEIGQFQTWIFELREASGTPLTGADVAIAGGMPGHGHGLPTQPRVTEELGNGAYRIEGVKLNMAGAWVIEVFVSTPTLRERLRFDLAIDY